MGSGGEARFYVHSFQFWGGGDGIPYHVIASDGS